MKKVILIIILLIIILGVIGTIAYFNKTENIQNNNNLEQERTEDNINNVIENSSNANDSQNLQNEGEEVSMEEGCLSLPGIHETVKRGGKIRVKYMDENFVEHEEVVEGYLARVMQHEFDHLDGKMFIDHLSPLRKQMIKGKLNAMLKGKAHCTYKVKTVK